MKCISLILKDNQDFIIYLDPKIWVQTLRDLLIGWVVMAQSFLYPRFGFFSSEVGRTVTHWLQL